MTSKSLYDVLGVTPEADDIVIRAAYRALIAKFHPDVNAAGGDRARAIVDAFAVLGRPESRAAYDQSRTARSVAVQPSPSARTGSVARRAPPRPIRRPVKMNFAYQGAGAATRGVRTSQWLLPAIALLIAGTSLIATYSLVYGADIGGIDLTAPGEEGVIAVDGVTTEQRAIPSLSRAPSGDQSSAGLAPATSSTDPAIVVPGANAEPLVVSDIVGAVNKFNEVAERGDSAVQRFSSNCARWARQANTLQAHDYCVAFDYAAGVGIFASEEDAASVSPYWLRSKSARRRAHRSAKRGAKGFNPDPTGVRFATVRQIVERNLPKLGTARS